MSNQASDLPFYDVFATQKVPLLKIFDDIISSDLWFGPPQSKILATPMVTIKTCTSRGVFRGGIVLVEEAYATWHFSIILISLRVEVEQTEDFLVRAKILPLRKAFFNLNLPHSTLGKKDIALIFYV